MDKYLCQEALIRLCRKGRIILEENSLVRCARQVGKSSNIRHLSSYGGQSEFTISNLFQAPHIIQHTDRRLRAEDMIAEGDDGFGGKMGFEGVDQEICLKQDAMVEGGNILISMMMGDEPADSFYLCGCEAIDL